MVTNNHTTTLAHRSSEAKVAEVAVVGRQSNSDGGLFSVSGATTRVQSLELTIAAVCSNQQT